MEANVAIQPVSLEEVRSIIFTLTSYINLIYLYMIPAVIMSSHCNVLRLSQILMNGYKFNVAEAVSLASFVKPLLELDPLKRPEPAELLSHPWLNESSTSKHQGLEMEGGGKRSWWSRLGMLGSRWHKQEKTAESGRHQILTIDPVRAVDTAHKTSNLVTFSEVAEPRAQNTEVTLLLKSIFSESLVSDELVL
jgi:serine/threonine protein kinase